MFTNCDTYLYDLYMIFIHNSQIIVGIVFFGGLLASPNGSNFFLIDDRGMDRYQYSADEIQVDRTETDHRESVEDK